jgi:hypothetical protein
MLVNTTTQRQRVTSIDLAKEIEVLFHLDLEAFYTLPVAAQIAILAKAKHAHDYAPIYAPRLARIEATNAKFARRRSKSFAILGSEVR